jgi:hypothetical protein
MPARDTKTNDEDVALKVRHFETPLGLSQIFETPVRRVPDLRHLNAVLMSWFHANFQKREFSVPGLRFSGGHSRRHFDICRYFDTMSTPYSVRPQKLGDFTCSPTGTDFGISIALYLPVEDYS